MKVSYDDLPKKFEEIKNQLSKSTQDAVEATLPIWDFYNDEDFKPTPAYIHPTCLYQLL